MSQNDVVQHFKGNGNKWTPYSELRKICSGDISYKMRDILEHMDIGNGFKLPRRFFRLTEKTYKEINGDNTNGPV